MKNKMNLVMAVMMLCIFIFFAGAYVSAEVHGQRISMLPLRIVELFYEFTTVLLLIYLYDLRDNRDEGNR